MYIQKLSKSIKKTSFLDNYQYFILVIIGVNIIVLIFTFFTIFHGILLKFILIKIIY